MSRARLGVHVPVAGGLARSGLAYADAVGAETVQLFTGNPRGWAHAPVDRAQDRAFRDGCESRGVTAWVHAPYLVNLGSPEPVTLSRSVQALAHSLARAAAVGARGVVVHTGSAVDEERAEAALRQVREALLPLLDRLRDDGPSLVLEPTAGQGRSLCSTVDDVGPYLEALGRHPGLGLCLDTCHAHAAGHDLSRRGAVGRLLTALREAAGDVPLLLVHLNDSKDPAGSRRDRHAATGTGTIGEPAFAALLRRRDLDRVDLVLETPGSRAAHADELARLRELRGGGRPR